MTSETDPATRRAVERVATNFPGRVIIPGRHPLSCQVIDMSENGALLEFRAAIWLPPRFHLNIEAMDTEAYCEVRHQRSNRVGVTFKRVTVKDAAEAEPQSTARRTADHWDAAEMETEAAPAAADFEFDAPPPEPIREPMAAPARRSVAAHARTTGTMRDQPAAAAPNAAPQRMPARPGSAIRANVRAAQEQQRVDAKQTSLIGRLFGR